MRKGPIRYILIVTFLLCFNRHPTHAFELKGLQPVQPHGVFSSFGTDTVEKGVFAAGTDFERSIDPHYYRATLKTGYGLSGNAELLFTVPYIFNWMDSEEGFEDVSFGVKHRIFRENGYGPSAAYVVKLSLPNGSGNFTTDGTVGAGIAVSKKLGPFSSILNLVYSRPFDDSFEDQIEIVAGFGLRASHDFDIVAELYSVNSYFSNDFDTVEGRIGYRIKTTENIYTLIGGGYDFKNRDPEFRLLVSFNFIFRKTQRLRFGS